MKKFNYLILGIICLLPLVGFGQTTEIENNLKARYPGAVVVLHSTSGGWYDILYDYGTANSKEGACDLNGKEIISPNKYSDVCKLEDEQKAYYYSVKIGDKAGICDITGKEILPCQYESVYVMLRGSIHLKKNGEVFETSMKINKSILPSENSYNNEYQNSQENSFDSGLKLTSAQREKCKSDIEYLYQMAEKEYPEAEYMFALEMHSDIGISDFKYKKYWEPFSENNNFVAAAHYYKKACEHGWKEAYAPYAEYCYYGRGNVEGGATEAIKCLEKLVTAEPKNLNAISNIGICHIRNKNYETGYNFLENAYNMWKSDSTLKINSEVPLNMSLLFYYGFIKNEYDGKKMCKDILINGLLVEPYQKFTDIESGFYDRNLEKAYVYVIHYCNSCSDEKCVNILLKSFNMVFSRENSNKSFDIDWIESKFNKYSGDSKCDFLFLN